MEEISIIDFVRVVKNLQVDAVVIPFLFGGTSADACSVVDVSESFAAPTRGSQEVTLTIDTRGLDIEETEQRVHATSKALRELRNERLNESARIVQVYPRQSVARYNGQDDNGRHYFSSDYRIIIERTQPK